jgi:hypothetical protein
LGLLAGQLGLGGSQFGGGGPFGIEETLAFRAELADACVHRCESRGVRLHLCRQNTIARPQDRFGATQLIHRFDVIRQSCGNGSKAVGECDEGVLLLASGAHRLLAAPLKGSS